MTSETPLPDRTAAGASIGPDPRAGAFTRARAAGRVLPVYPGPEPASLEEAYAIQDSAIALWPDRLSGWKVGRINPPWDGRLGTDRLIGPIFERTIRRDSRPVFDMPAFDGGFIAVEGECVVILGADAPADRLDWTLEDARQLVGSVRLGVEVASSPFPGINDLGPLVTISDFGNNMGLIIGPEIPGWQSFEIADWRFETRVDGASVGAATPASIPGGPLESLRACLEIAARRGRPLAAGACVSTGAVTGVHPVAVGQTAVIALAGVGALTCCFVPAPPA